MLANHIFGRFFALFFLFATLGASPTSILLHAQENEVAENSVALPPPDNVELDILINKGNRLLAKEQFGEALSLWQLIQEQEPKNANINFKLGLCYRNSLDERDKALSYFRKATSSMTNDYNFGDNKSAEAPYDALYFLGEAYLESGEPDSALQEFKDYEGHYKGDPPIPVDRKVRMCINARDAKKSPRNVSLVNLGESLNTDFAETNPVVTIDNSIVFFSSRRIPEGKDLSEAIDPKTGKGFEDIYLASRNAQGEWSEAGRFPLSTAGNEAPLALSADGLTLYFRKEEKDVSNLYTSIFADGVWEKPVKMGGSINSAYNEDGITVSGDGNLLVFCSDRENGQGGFDLYVCERKSNGKWSKAQNLSPAINSPFNEVSPFIHPSGKTLFFSSNGYHNKGMGGYDVYYSVRDENGSWGEPQNMGYPINTTRDDLHYYITQGGTRYYAQITEGRSFDLFQIKGGGYDVENLEIGTEVVTLTEEMDVTEVLEVEREVEKEIEVVEFVETEVMTESEVEVVDLSALDDLEGEGGIEEVTLDSLDALEEDTIPEEPEPEPLDIDIEGIDLDRLDSLDRRALIDKVNSYLTDGVKTEVALDFKTIYFDFNSRTLSLLSKKELGLFLDILKENPKAKVQIVGHTDEKGDWAINMRISQQRAQVVRDFLAANGISQNRIVHYGMGSSQPVASNDHEDGRKLNRRVKLSLLK